MIELSTVELQIGFTGIPGGKSSPAADQNLSCKQKNFLNCRSMQELLLGAVSSGDEIPDADVAAAWEDFASVIALQAVP